MLQKYLGYFVVVVVVVVVVTLLLLAGCDLTSSKAALQVTSTPAAEVFIDGNKVGRAPYYSDQLKGKEYEIRIASGSASWVAKVKLTGQTTTYVNRELGDSPLSSAGEILTLGPGSGLTVVTAPSESEVKVDNQNIGTSPLTTKTVTAGNHLLEVFKDGYQGRAVKIRVTKGYHLTANISLAALENQVTAAAPTVKVKQTSTGWLRVRKDSSLSADEIARVNADEAVPLIEEVSGWYKIRTSDGVVGWISADFATKNP